MHIFPAFSFSTRKPLPHPLTETISTEHCGPHWEVIQQLVGRQELWRHRGFVVKHLRLVAPRANIKLWLAFRCKVSICSVGAHVIAPVPGKKMMNIMLIMIFACWNMLQPLSDPDRTHDHSCLGKSNHTALPL